MGRLRNEQPGLEVALSNAPEVIARPSEGYLIPASPSGPKLNTPHEVELPTKQGLSKRRTLIWIVGATFATALIIGAVVGGVVGNRAGSNRAPSSITESSLPVPVNTTVVRPNSKLAVTGWRLSGNGFIYRIFWQGGDNKLRSSQYRSVAESWSLPIVFEDIDAKPGTPVAAAIFLYTPQYEIFYLNRSSTLRGFNFGVDETVPSPDSINEKTTLGVGSSSEIGAYWPYVVYQNRNGTFQEVSWISDSGNQWTSTTMTSWSDTSFVPLGSNSTGVTVIPAVSNYGPPYTAGIVYRRDNGMLSIFAFGGDDTDIVWRSDVPDVTIPSDTAIGAFAFARTSNHSLTNTYILYQDDDSMIKTVWQEESAEWKGPVTVGGADPGTDIACLTEQVGEEVDLVVRLSRRSDMALCFWQLNGLITEKRLTASGWEDMGAIPM